jgi:hypothetical protein
LNYLRDLFNAICNAHLFRKCTFCTNHISSLGYVVTTLDIEVDPANIERIKNFPQPKMVTQVRSFIGLDGSFWRFVKDFGFIVVPHNELTNKDVPFIRGDAQQETFNFPILERLLRFNVMLVELAWEVCYYKRQTRCICY